MVASRFLENLGSPLYRFVFRRRPVVIFAELLQAVDILHQIETKGFNNKSNCTNSSVKYTDYVSSQNGVLLSLSHQMTDV